ncbi:hypothetical protein J7337_012931 [Fusarium musae]|uniref:Uncharacterized protein n=1 Tax=Fusarium musae TaxID=1042133 RepID=A0A9P8D6P8_9HYPO|nr:hypothetical protein J7337_012931 [Fusarium musae]KAG9496344.1 hypothetical protein J7337_012931 [Fusarium musae]
MGEMKIISELEQADPQAVTNLKKWVNGTGSIARAESRFLNYPLQELLSTSPRDESAMIGLENNVAENLLRVRDYVFPVFQPFLHLYGIPHHTDTLSRAIPRKLQETLPIFTSLQDQLRLSSSVP